MKVANLGVCLLLPLVLLTGCAAPGAVVAASVEASGSYKMPLSSSPSPSAEVDLVNQPGAAGRVVQCTGPVASTTVPAPFDGEDSGATPQSALDAARKWARWDGAQEWFALARVEGARRLYVFEVDGVAKQALILRHGPTLKGDGTRATVIRWWLESWARCDYAEMPESVVQAQGLQIWTNANGKRQLTSAINSFDFGAGCYSGMTALDLGGPVSGSPNEQKRVPVEYVRDPAPELQKEYFQGDYAQHATVPDGAIDSGYERDGKHLWFSADRTYAYVGAADDAEAWPRAKQPIRCA